MTEQPNRRRPIPRTIRTSFGSTTSTGANCLLRKIVANRVLPGTIRSNWDNPGQLYNVIVAALNDGFRADILRAAEQI